MTGIPMTPKRAWWRWRLPWQRWLPSRLSVSLLIVLAVSGVRTARAGATTVPPFPPPLNAPVVGVNPDGSLFALVFAPDRTMTEYSNESGSWSMSTLSSAVPIYSPPGLIDQSNGEPSFFVWGQNTPLWYYRFANGQWSAQPITPGFVSWESPPVVVQQPDGQPSIFYVASGPSPSYAGSQALWNTWYANGTWYSGTVAPYASGTVSSWCRNRGARSLRRRRDLRLLPFQSACPFALVIPLAGAYGEHLKTVAVWV